MGALQQPASVATPGAVRQLRLAGRERADLVGDRIPRGAPGRRRVRPPGAARPLRARVQGGRPRHPRRARARFHEGGWQRRPARTRHRSQRGRLALVRVLRGPQPARGDGARAGGRLPPGARQHARDRAPAVPDAREGARANARERRAAGARLPLAVERARLLRRGRTAPRVGLGPAARSAACRTRKRATSPPSRPSSAPTCGRTCTAWARSCWPP